ncbi:MAG TPA: NUDIX hydrolase [Chloroflexota bacterium]|nr:NUDIX hydrolase [Chloroflexota bacterium]
MISWETGGVQFNYRVAAVIVDRDRVLVTRIEGMDFWFLPGGRVEMGETSEKALAREVMEELHVPAEIGRLLWVVENFFGAEPRIQELGLYYAATLIGLGRVWDGIGIYRTIDDEGTRDEFRWLPFDDLSSVRLMPPFLKEVLTELPTKTQHIVVNE